MRRYPGDSGSGYTLVTLPDGSKTGSVVEFMRSIANEAQFTWEVVPLRQESRSRYSSSFTACVHQVTETNVQSLRAPPPLLQRTHRYQVALNESDLCIANFWLTTERMLIRKPA